MTIAQGHGAAEVMIYFPPQARTGRLSELVRNRSRKPASLCGLGVRIAHLPPVACSAGACRVLGLSLNGRALDF